MAGRASAAIGPWALTAAGAIPFVALTPQGAETLRKTQALRDLNLPGFDCVLSRAPELQRSYAASIVSFLGAVHWGTAMGAGPGGRWVTMRYLWGVTPSLLGWGSLNLPEVYSLGGLIATLGSCYAVDRAAIRHGLLPKWYGPIRTTATTMAISGLSLSLYSVWSKQRKQRRAAVQERRKGKEERPVEASEKETKTTDV